MEPRSAKNMGYQDGITLNNVAGTAFLLEPSHSPYRDLSVELQRWWKLTAPQARRIIDKTIEAGMRVQLPADGNCGYFWFPGRAHKLACPCGRTLMMLRGNPQRGLYYRCRLCGAQHQATIDGSPTGTPTSDPTLLQLRKEAHEALDTLWTYSEGRRVAYIWLAEQMGLDESECHIGMFNVKQCQLVIDLCARTDAAFIEPKRKRQVKRHKTSLYARTRG